VSAKRDAIAEASLSRAVGPDNADAAIKAARYMAAVAPMPFDATVGLVLHEFQMSGDIIADPDELTRRNSNRNAARFLRACRA